MDITASKWDILNIIAQKPSAPLEIAKTLQTSIANVSQQLRLLEAAGLVTRKRVSNSQPGKPRALFSLSRDFCDISVLSDGFAEKKQLTLNKESGFVARALLYEELGLVLIKWFFRQSEYPFKLYLSHVTENTIYLEASPGPGTEKKESIKYKEKEYIIHILYVQQPKGVLLYS